MKKGVDSVYGVCYNICVGRNTKEKKRTDGIKEKVPDGKIKIGLDFLKIRRIISSVR